MDNNYWNRLLFIKIRKNQRHKNSFHTAIFNWKIFVAAMVFSIPSSFHYVSELSLIENIENFDSQVVVGCNRTAKSTTNLDDVSIQKHCNCVLTEFHNKYTHNEIEKMVKDAQNIKNNKLLMSSMEAMAKKCSKTQ